MPRLSLRLLGGFHLRLESRSLALPARKAQALLAYLALRPGRPHSRESLTALFWGNVGERQARQSLRQTVFRIRKVFAAAKNPSFVVQAETIAVNAAAVDVDVASFERLIRKRSPAALAAAITLYEGPLLDGLRVDEEPFESWLRSERDRLRELIQEALTRLLAQQMKRGPAETAIQTAGRLLALDPLQEGAHRTLMRLFARQGRRAAALRQYQACVAVLRKELGVEPEAETKRVYQEILQRQARTSAGAARAGEPAAESPLVGREEEVGHLRRTLREILRGQGRVLLLTGETGIGKSRLIEELAAEAGRSGCRVLLGRAYETEQILPFRPWVDALRAGTILSETEALESLPRAWRGELVRLFPELSASGVQPQIIPENSVRLFEVIDALIAHVAARRPLVVVLEDLHWADELSLRLFSFVGRRVGARPLLLVGTAREEELPDAPALRRSLHELEPEPHVNRVTLSSLSERSTAGLVGALARAGSSRSRVAELAQKVWAMSSGNPFVIVETMRALQENRGLPSAGLSLPHRVREVLTAHLDRLGAKSQSLVAVAAVVEREFSFNVLQQASGLSRRDSAEGIEELVRRRILHAVGEGFDFTHGWFRSVVYDDLLAPRRQALHAAVGEALESVYAEQLDEVYDRLAYHFSRADEPTKAFDYLVRLAGRAARSYASEEAVRILQDARAWIDRLPADQRDRRQLDLVSRLAHCLLFLGRSAEARELLGKEEARIERLRDPSLSGPFYFWVSYTDANLGHAERAAQAALRALEEAARCGDQTTMGLANCSLSRNSYWLGRSDGIAQGRQAVALLERTEERWWLGQSYLALGLNLYHIGDFTPALEALEQTRAIGEAIGDTRLQSQAVGNMSRVHSLRGEHETGLALAQRGLELAPDPVSRALGLVHMALAEWENGDSKQAIPVLEKALAQTQFLRGRGGYVSRQVDALLTSGLSEMHLHAGDLSQATQLAQKAQSTAAEIKWPVAMGYAERALGAIARTQGDFAQARSYFSQSVKIFAGADTRFQAARARLLLAEALHAGGEQTSASFQLKEARDAFRLLRVPLYVERAERLAKDLGLALDDFVPPAPPANSLIPRD